MKVKEFLSTVDASMEIHFTLGDWIGCTMTIVGAERKFGEAEILEASIYNEKTLHLKINETLEMVTLPAKENKWLINGMS